MVEMGGTSLSSSSTVKTDGATRLSNWMYGTELEEEFHAGRTLQSCHPGESDWLSDLQLDLRAASARRKTVHCVVANTDTWYVHPVER